VGSGDLAYATADVNGATVFKFNNVRTFSLTSPSTFILSSLFLAAKIGALLTFLQKELRYKMLQLVSMPLLMLQLQL
jgi:hypothetical protein